MSDSLIHLIQGVAILFNSVSIIILSRRGR